MSQQNKRKTRSFTLDIRSERKNLIISYVIHAYDHIDANSCLKHFAGLCRSLYPDKLRRRTEIEVNIFLIYLSLDLPVLFEDECIIITADHEDTPHSESHEGIIIGINELSEKFRFYRVHKINMSFCGIPLR